MQHAVHNRTTMRVANRKGVSGRVTANDVNLDGFHSPIRKLMRLIARRWLVLATASMGLYLVIPDRGLAQNNQGQNDQGINLVVPNGTYAFRDTGQVTLPGSTTPILIAAAGRITFIPTGTINGQVIGKTRGVLTASINGQISPITINGSFSVNPDGSVFEIEQQTGGPNALLHFTDYPTPDGNTITFVETDPGSILGGLTRDEASSLHCRKPAGYRFCLRNKYQITIQHNAKLHDAILWGHTNYRR